MWFSTHHGITIECIHKVYSTPMYLLILYIIVNLLLYARDPYALHLSRVRVFLCADC